jgi:hypothetical protein
MHGKGAPSITTTSWEIQSFVGRGALVLVQLSAVSTILF